MLFKLKLIYVNNNNIKNNLPWHRILNNSSL